MSSDGDDTGAPRRRRSRRLSATEKAAWEAVARTATPLRSHSYVRSGAVQDDPAPSRPAPLSAREVTALSHQGEMKPIAPARREGGSPPISFDLHDPTPAPVGRPEAGLDRRTAERLRRGERSPDARLDLHGMTAERAHAALDRFLSGALRDQHRCVLVITGKGGKPVADDAGYMRPDRGVLRQAVPRWLRAGRFARDIVGIFEAHRRHGGAGALYIYLKRRR